MRPARRRTITCRDPGRLPPTAAGVWPTHPTGKNHADMVRETEVNITLYSQPGCVQCNAIKRKFKTEGLVEGEDFTVVDVSLPENAGDLEAIKYLGYQRVPVTMVNEEHFDGYDVNKVADAIARKKRTRLHVVEDAA